MKTLSIWSILVCSLWTINLTLHAQCSSNLDGFTFLGEFEDHYYYVSDDKARWEAASEIANENGGYLASINTAAENEYILSKIDEIVFIGFNDIATNGDFKWDSGESVEFNNLATTNSSLLFYGTMNFWNGEWALDGIYVSRKYLLEIDCQDSNPTNPGNGGSSDLEINCKSNYEIFTNIFTGGYAKLDYADLLNGRSDCSENRADIVYSSLLPEYPNGTSLASGDYELSVEVVDRCGNKEACNFNLTVIGFDNNDQTDLSASSLNLQGGSYSNYTVGQFAEISFYLDSRGEPINQAVEWAFYLSETETLSSNAVLLSSITRERVNSNGRLREFGFFQIPEETALGEYYIIVQSDNTNVIDEANEDNNSLSQKINVVGKPDFDDYCSFNVVDEVTLNGQEFLGFNIRPNGDGIIITSILERETSGQSPVTFVGRPYDREGDGGWGFAISRPRAILNQFAVDYTIDNYGPTTFKIDALDYNNNGLLNNVIALAAADAAELISIDFIEVSDHLLIPGVYRTTDNAFRSFLIKTDTRGRVIWQQIYEASNDAFDFTFKQESTEGAYYFLADNQDNSAVFIQAINAFGELVWNTPITDNGENMDIVFRGESLDASSIFYTRESNGNLALISLDSDSGDTQWSINLAASLSDNLNLTGQSIDGILITTDGIIVSATLNDNLSKYAKLDLNGNVEWALDFPEGKEAAIPQYYTPDGGIVFGKYNTAESTINAFYVNELGSFEPECIEPPLPNPCLENIAGYELLGEFEGVNLYISNSKLSPAKAWAAANSIRGNLAIIESQEKNDFIQSKIDEQVYIGMNDRLMEGQLKWGYTTSATFFNFDDDCGFCPSNSADNDYVLMNPWNGEWSWSNNYTSKRYIVEITCTDGPTLSLSANNTIYDATAQTNDKKQQVDQIDLDWQVFPNPATNQVSVAIGLDQSLLGNIELYNINGQLMSTKEQELVKGSNTVLFTVDQLPNGIYFIRIPQLSNQALRFVKM